MPDPDGDLLRSAIFTVRKRDDANALEQMLSRFTRLSKYRYAAPLTELRSVLGSDTLAELDPAMKGLGSGAVTAALRGGIVIELCDLVGGDQGDPDPAIDQWYLERIGWYQRAGASVGAPVLDRHWPGWEALGDPPWSGVKVAQIDTGYTAHTVFRRPVTDPGDLYIRPELGKNFMTGEDQNNPLDPLIYKGTPGHGTRILSVLAGWDGAGPPVFRGVAPRATVVPYRISNCVVIDFLDHETELHEAIDHAADQNCDVINISMGDPLYPNPLVAQAIDDAYDKGVIVVAAAGNFSWNVYPGLYSRTVTVGGTTKGDDAWSGSARGQHIDVAAPGAGIDRAMTLPGTGGPDTSTYTYGRKADGTSYATAMVSGAAALWIARTDEPNRRTRSWQRVESFRKHLRATARTPGNWPERLGAGVLDVEALLHDDAAPDVTPGDKRDAAYDEAVGLADLPALYTADEDNDINYHW